MPRKPDTRNLGLLLQRRRQPLGVRRREVDNEADNGHRLMLKPANAKPAHLDQPGQFRGGTNEQAAVMRLEEDAVIGHELRECKMPRLRRLDECQREPRLTAAGRASDKHGAAADQHS